MDKAELLRAARVAYERRRILRALGLASLLALCPLSCCGVGTSWAAALIVSLLLLVLGAVALWRGQSAGRALAPGLLLGLVPLGLALGARAYGHVCMGQACASLCVPACAAGGLFAGAAVAMLARKAPQPWLVVGVGGGAAMLVGCLGCSCVGSSGIVGLALGMLVSLGCGMVGRIRPVTG